MNINGNTQIFGLLGNPIEHTLSPFIHGLLYKQTDFNGTYNPFLVPEGQLEYAVKGMKALSIKGLNVTVPYKVDVMLYLDEVDVMAKKIGACNTIVSENNRLIGYNTDWVGLKKVCEYEQVILENRDCVILGAGGAARAVALMCLNEGAKSITILNRTIDKAETIISIVKNNANQDFVCHFQTGTLEEVEKVKPDSIVFQTTSLGMHPIVEKTPINLEQEEAFYSKVDFIIDIIYNPKETTFMKKGNLHGVKSVNGLGMLFFQAVSAFELWTGLTMTLNQINKARIELDDYVYNK